MMILSISTRFLTKVSILITGQFNTFIHPQLSQWIGLETQGMLELSIKPMLKSFMTLKVLNKLQTEPPLFSKLLCGTLLLANSVGKLWEFSHMVQTVQISIASMLQKIDNTLLPEMISVL
jgi:hypothetical protein